MTIEPVKTAKYKRPIQSREISILRVRRKSRADIELIEHVDLELTAISKLKFQHEQLSLFGEVSFTLSYQKALER